MKRIFFFVLSIFICIRLFSQNLILNPGFETWQRLNKPTGWTTALGCLKDSTVILSGIYSCRQASTTESRDLGQVIQVTEGKLYTISLWYRNELSGNGCRIWANWKDSEGNPLSDDASLPLLHSAYLKSDTWKQYSADVTAPPAAAYFSLIIRTLPNSVTYWENVVFEESIPTSVNELISHGISIYPNPACNYLTISNIHNIQLIEIQTLTGIIICTYRINGEESLMIPLSGFKKGIYIIIMYSSTRRYSGRFIKTGF